MPLSDTILRKMKVPAKPIMIPVDNGLYLEVRSTGAKTWKLRLWENGKERKISLGRHPQVSLLMLEIIEMELKQAKQAKYDIGPYFVLSSPFSTFGLDINIYCENILPYD